MIATDGLWDRFTNEEVAHIVMDPDFYGYRDPDGCAQYLIKESSKRWKVEQGMIDDITIVIAYLSV